MIQIYAPTERIRELLDGKTYIAETLNKEILDELGFFVLRSAISTERAEHYLQSYKKMLQDGILKRSEFHSTEVKISHVEDFNDLVDQPGLKTVWPNFYGGQVASSFQRIISKYKDSPAPVILHQDTSYQFGDFEQYSLFTALTECDKNNGGLKLYPGTSKLGYLADAGALNAEVLPSDLPICCPKLNPGDILIMHSATWHFSDSYLKGEERIYLEIHIVSSHSPFAQKNIAGASPTGGWKVEFDLVEREESNFFVQSRSQRLKEALEKLSKLDA